MRKIVGQTSILKLGLHMFLIIQTWADKYRVKPNQFNQGEESLPKVSIVSRLYNGSWSFFAAIHIYIYIYVADICSAKSTKNTAPKAKKLLPLERASQNLASRTILKTIIQKNENGNQDYAGIKLFLRCIQIKFILIITLKLFLIFFLQAIGLL